MSGHSEANTSWGLHGKHAGSHHWKAHNPQDHAKSYVAFFLEQCARFPLKTRKWSSDVGLAFLRESWCGPRSAGLCLIENCVLPHSPQPGQSSFFPAPQLTPLRYTCSLSNPSPGRRQIMIFFLYIPTFFLVLLCHILHVCFSSRFALESQKAYFVSLGFLLSLNFDIGQLFLCPLY